MHLSHGLLHSLQQIAGYEQSSEPPYDVVKQRRCLLLGLSVLLVTTPVHPPFNRHSRPLTRRILHFLERDSFAAPADPSGRIIPDEPVACSEALC